MKPAWIHHAPNPDRIRDLCLHMGCSPLLAGLLVSRGVETPDAANAWLHPCFAQLRSPDALYGMDAAVDRVVAAIHKNETIMIFGDYDVDGVTATLIVKEFLEHTGTPVIPLIPHRVEDGYSIKPHHITRNAMDAGVSLIITVDCGIGSNAAVDAANAAGIDMIITDHHEAGDTLPNAIAIIDPKQPDCNSGLRNLAGAGVAFYLIIAVRARLRTEGFWRTRKEPNLKSFCDLVALGTIADIVPLTGENRILAWAGLEVMRTRPRPGILSLMAASKVTPASIDSEAVSFRMAPRLNAPGRIERADVSLALLSAASVAEAAPIADELTRINTLRQQMERETTRSIIDHINANPELMEAPCLVMADDSWHPGILGISASRLVNRYHKPVILIAVKNAACQGSGRSIPGVDLVACLSACSDHLTGFGGHAMAAGVRLDARDLPAFNQRFRSAVDAQTAGMTAAVSELSIDAVITFDRITEASIREISRMAPFGEANPEPVFQSDHIHVIHAAPLGTGGHWRLMLEQTVSGRSYKIEAVWFNGPQQFPARVVFEKIAYHMRINDWNGRQRVRLSILAAVS